MTKALKKKSCRHRNSWLIGGGRYEWCYECGAIRMIKPVHPEDPRCNQMTRASSWALPRPGQDNPFDKWKESEKKYA